MIVHRVTHLVKRFWWALTARRVAAADREWIEATLGPGEQSLFARLSRADQEHHVRVARRFVARLDRPDPPQAWVAAALLHDVGKLACGLGTFGRVFATVWPFGRRADGRIARYHRHERIGAMMLREVGSAPVTVALVGEWGGAPPEAAAALEWADDL